MNFAKCWCLLCCCSIFFVYQITIIEAELFTQFSVFQIVFAVSWPIPYKNPMRKLFFNTGFQFNYAEPFALSNFYKPMYFQDAFTNRELPVNTNNATDTKSTNFNESEVEVSDSDLREVDTASDGGVIETKMIEIEAPDVTTTETIRNQESEDITEAHKAKPKSRSLNTADSIGSDITAGQLYDSIERNLVETGYHRSCLLKSICELAKHPLHKEDDEEHLLLDMINFMLKPTQHNGFASHESYEQDKYEAAQNIGESGHNCDEIYSDCDNSILNHFSYLEIF